jgi:hypothetical protein
VLNLAVKLAETSLLPWRRAEAVREVSV